MLKRYDVDLPHRERGELPGLLNIGLGFKGDHIIGGTRDC